MKINAMISEYSEFYSPLLETVMRQILLSGAAAIFMAGAAFAADLPSSAPPAPFVPVPYFTWTGFYAGLQVGYSFEKDKTKEYYTHDGSYTGVEFKYNPDTALAGGHLGANYQIGALVLGVEGDVEVLRARGGFNDAGGRSPADPGGVGRVTRDWQSSIRGRIGYAMDRIMIYATGGATFTEFDYYYYNPVVRAGEGTSKTRSGWTAGLGVNYAMTDNIILGLEYRHADYGRFNYVAKSAFLGLTGRQEPTSDSVRASIAYKF